MKFKGHTISFVLVWIGLLIWRYYINDINWTMFKGLIFGYIAINPDYDLLFQKMVVKIKRVKKKLKISKPVLHRWWFTHSIAYPLFMYWLIKDFGITNAKELGFCLFLPVMIHLICDFKVYDLIDGDKYDTMGFWRISIFGKRLSPEASVCWMIVNVILVSIYTYWIYI